MGGNRYRSETIAPGLRHVVTIYTDGQPAPEILTREQADAEIRQRLDQETARLLEEEVKRREGDKDVKVEIVFDDYCDVRTIRAARTISHGDWLNFIDSSGVVVASIKQGTILSLTHEGA